MPATEFGNDALNLHRSLERWERFTFHKHDSLEAFRTAPLPYGLHSIHCDQTILDLVISARKGAPLVICLNGSSPRSETAQPPFFSGFNVQPANIPVSIVAVSDPTIALTPDLKLAWYAGSSHADIQKILPSVFDRIIDYYEPSSVIFMGGSGGGFASIYFASKIKDSIALVWNPQTDILSYNITHVREYAEAAFGFDSDTDIALLADQTDTRLEFGGQKPICKIVYLQNGSDWHVKAHMNAMLQRMGLPERAFPFAGMVADNFFLYIGDWGQGHAVPPKHVLTALLEKLYTQPEQAFSDGGSVLLATLSEAFAAVP